jgi:hypothetical protein
MGNNMALQTSGFAELIQSLEKAGKDSRRAAERALKNGKKAITPGIREAVARHHRTGRTEASLDQKDEVNWEGTVAEANIGFMSVFYGYDILHRNILSVNAGEEPTATVMAEIFVDRDEYRAVV